MKREGWFQRREASTDNVCVYLQFANNVPVLFASISYAIGKEMSPRGVRSREQARGRREGERGGEGEGVNGDTTDPEEKDGFFFSSFSRSHSNTARALF